MKETLLEQAKKIKLRKRKNKEVITDEHIDLAIGWAEDIISLSQVSRVLKKSTGGAVSNLPLFLREGFRRGKIIREKVGKLLNK